MRELPDTNVTPVLIAEFKQAVNGGSGDLDAWLECNNEAEVRAFILAIQKQAYEEGLRDAWKESTDREFGGGFAEYLSTASQKEAK